MRMRNAAGMNAPLRPLALAILCLSSAGCGQAGDKASGGLYAKVLADAATKECLQARDRAPNSAYAGHVQKLCDCTRDRIIAANPGPLEEEQSRRAKLKDALDSCVAELGPPEAA
jgi:hypothetical protein